MTLICGIKNCDTMKKALTWLDAQGVAHDFHDYKKDGLAEAAVAQALSEHGWEAVINRRGTTWRQLPPDVQNAMDGEMAMQVARDNPSIVKRPLLVHDGKSYLGFKPDQYAQIFG